MLFNILQKLKSIFAMPDEQKMLNDFIVSNNPKTISDVEHLVTVYDNNRKRSQSLIYWW